MDIKEVHDAIHILYTNGTSKDLIKRAINNIFNRSFPASVPTIADILIDEKDYPLALEYCNLALESIHIDELYFLKARCHFSLKEYNECLNSLNKITNEYYMNKSEDMKELALMKIPKSKDWYSSVLFDIMKSILY